MPNNTKKNVRPPIVIIGPKTSNTQPFGTYASNKGGRRRRRQTQRKSRARK
jgi:hypothetical protein